MRKSLFRYFTVTLAVLIILAFQTWNVAAKTDRTEGELPYRELVIQLMPEYVTPNGWKGEVPVLLYGQHGMFINESEEVFEGSFTIDVPVNDPTLYLALVGKFNDQGQVDDLEYTVNEEAGTITWTPAGGVAPGEEYRYVVEYYYSPFDGDAAREFSFHFQLDRETENMTVLIFEPFGAEDMSLSVDPDRVTDMFGVPVHGYDFEGLTAGEEFNLQVSYIKDDNISTLEALESQQPPNDDVHAGIGGNSGSVTGGDNYLISTENAVMISISVIIAGLLVFFGLKSYKSPPVQEVGRNSLSQKVAKVDIQAEKKTLRQQLMNGEIDETTYRNKMRKLS
ncbi:hypothetical protein J2S74_005260 [Evansella vedderi]|uniref:SHOCT domain-containing protein n=1 Tax=Evansella vedderi TaxID=38282 RepID=A0ABU0A523_9BACI|nr:hypothetical protein [Evansella vedderi]MDQ0257798.1 hypothetical protein [Evansella vedderi]